MVESLSSNCIDVEAETEVLESVSIATASLLKGKTGQQLKSVLIAALKIIGNVLKS